MQIARDRTMASLIALFLMSAMAVSLVALPAANAHAPVWQIPTFAYIEAVPSPVGIGQYTHIYMWIDKTMSGAALTNDIRPHNYKLTITKPDGTAETMTWDVCLDPTSSQGYNYAPDQIGTYTLKFEYQGQTYTWSGAYQNDTYLPSTASTTLTVQQEPISDFPSSYPLPTEYWTRPIYAENPGWWTISSNWLGSGSPQVLLGRGGTRYFPDGVGPQTSHVMWTKPVQSGGVVGGDMFETQGDTYFEGSAYIQRMVNPIIVAGKLYYKEPLGYSSASGGPTDCIDLRTGEIIWSRTDVPSLSFASIYDSQQPNEHGVMQPVLCTTNFAQCFDADTGNPLYNFTGVPSGAKAFGPQGEYLIYVIANAGTSGSPAYYLAQWNSTNPTNPIRPTQSGIYPANAPITPAPSGTNTYWNGSKWVSNAERVAQGYASVTQPAYDWNVSIPWRNTMSSSPTVIAAFCNDMMLCYNGTLPSITSWTPYTYFAVNLNSSKGAIGSVLWWNTLSAPAGNLTITQGGIDPVNHVFLEGYKETMQWVGYSMTTGQKLWGPTPSQLALDYYGIPGTENRMCQIAYGKLYSGEFSGVIYCYDEMTGKLLWTYGNGGPGNSTNSGFQVPGNYPTSIQAIANGIIYTVTTEHTIETPPYKGALARAINATDGTEIWTLSDYTGEFGDNSYAIADGYATFFNGLDDQIYVVGRGPSVTTVQAPMTAITAGNTVVIQGTVTDIAAGTKQKEQAARFPNGVPAVSDASMSDWMGYVYQQKPHPASATGVTVTLDAVDPNNNFIHIGTVTSDTSGLFHYAWTPPNIPGEYTVIATFPGTNGYWPSYAETAMYVQEAPPATPAPTYPVPIDYTMSIIGAAIAIIIVVIIVGILILRKK